jgi:uncharacterized protein involved in outer membrane biogenesis
MQLATGAGRIALAGDLDWSPDFSATDLRLDVDLPDLGVAGRLLGLELPAQPLKLAANFAGTSTAFRMRKLTGTLGPSDFSGQLSLKLAQKPELDVEIRSQLLDITSLSGGEAASPGAARPAGGRLIPDTPLPLRWLDRLDGRFNVTAARTRIANFALQDLRLTALLRNGRLLVDPLELHGPFGGRFAIRGEVIPGTPGITANLAVTARQMIFSPWTEAPEQAVKHPKGDIDVQLTGGGRTWRELAGSLEGRLRLVAGPGETPAAGLDRLLGNLWRSLVRSIRGRDAPTTMKLRCLALVTDVTKGIAVTAPVLAFQTEQVNVISHGTLNLRDETVEIYLRTTPRSRIGISAGEIINPYVKIAGPLSAPGVAVDAKGTLFSGGAAFATAGLSIVAKSLWDRMFRAKDPCAAALEEADRLAAQPASKKPRWLPGFLRPG